MNTKRLAALLLSLAMLLSLSMASAQEQMPMAGRQMEVIKSGKSIETTTTLKVNAETVGALIAQMQGETSPEAMNMFTTLIGALNKLVIKSLVSMESSAKESVNFNIGTDKASLVDAKADVDLTTGENAIALNMLPGIILKMDQAQMAAALQQNIQLQQHPEMLQMMAEKYSKVVEEAFTKEILPGLKAEEGKFTVEEGEFDTHVEGDLTPVTAAKFVKAVAAVVKDDAELKQLLDAAIGNSLKSAAAQGNSESAPIKNTDEALAALNEKMDSVISENSDQKVLHLDAYMNKAGKAMLIGIDTPASDGTAVSLSLLIAPKENGNSMKAHLLFKPVAPDTELDWAKVKEAVKAGEDMSATVVDADIENTKDADKLHYTLNIKAAASGMPIGLSVTGEETLTGAYDSNVKISLSFLAPDPLLEINAHSVESDMKPEKVVADGAQVVEIKGNASEEDMAPLMQVLQEKGLPMLMENLSKALPDEAGLIMQLMNGGAAEEGTIKAN